MALALLLRLTAIAADDGYRPANDAFEYDYLARSIAAGDGYPPSGYLLQGGPTAIRGPGYPFLLGGVYAVSGDSVTAGRFLGALLGALAVALLYLVVKRIWGRRTGLVAAGLAAVFPPLVLLSRDLFSESLFIVLELAAILCVLEFRRSGGLLRWAAVAGGCSGLALLTRPTGLGLAIAIAIGLWTLRPRLRAAALVAPATGLLCAAAVTVPWVVRDAVEFGRFVPVTTSGGFAAAGTYNEASYRDPARPGAWRTPQAIPRFKPLFTTPGVDEAAMDSALREAVRDFAWQHPAYVVEATAWNLLRLFEIEGGSVVDRRGAAVDDRGIGSADPVVERIGLALAVALATIGVVAMLRNRGRHGRPPSIPRGPLFFWLVPILMAIFTAPVAGLPRYRLPLDPFLLTLAAIGLLTLVDRAPAQGVPRPESGRAA